MTLVLRALCLFLCAASLQFFSPRSALAAASANVRVNSVGYPAALSKRATVLTAAGNNAFNVRRVSDNSSAFAGTLGNVVVNADTTQNVRFADFDALNETGNFYLDVTGVGTSVNFTVGPAVYNNSMWVNIMGYYNQRCGMAHSMTHNGNTWGHAACHLGDGNLTHYSGSNTVKNGTGGWHDAGDFGKYIVNAGITVGQMLQAWERYRTNLQSLTTPAGTNAALPDYLEEAKWEMDWVLKMQFPDGRVSHKLTRTGFEPYPLFPNADTDTRYFVPWGSPATAYFVGICALAARQFQPYDAAYATTLLNAATLSYNFLVANPANVAPDQSCCSTGGYGTTDGDGRLWAAVEMWETTGNAAQLTDAETRINGLGGDKSDYNWDWDNVSNLGIYTYALSSRAGRNATTLADVRADIITDANAAVTAANAHGYGRALGMYYWGANGTVPRQCEMLDVANRITPNSAYLSAAQQQLSWIYGRNYFNRSQVTGEGINPPLNPHDRESSADAVVNPKPGHLVGGGHPGATNWVDDSGDYAQNEIAINWDGAMTYALAMFYVGPVVNTPTISPTHSRSPTFSPSPTATPTPTPLPCGAAATLRRVNVGGIGFTDGSSNLWSADQAYIAGGWGYTGTPATSTSANPQANTTDDALYQAQRYGDPLTYRFTLANGVYRVTVKLSETYHAGAGARVFDVAADGGGLTGIDIFALAPGANRALDLTFTAVLSDGILDIAFTATVDNATVAGIQIDSVTSGPCSSPTSSITPSNSPTRSPTPSSTVSPSPSPSPSPTRSATPSSTISPTHSLSPSQTRTVSPSNTPSPSQTPSNSPSPSATRSATPSISPSPSQTPSISPTFSESRTITPGNTPTFTITPTNSPSPTGSPSITQTRTGTASPSGTPSASDTPSSTGTATSTSSPSPSPSHTPSISPTFSVSGTITPGDSPTSTISPSSTETNTGTPSRTPTPSSSATMTVTLTRSPTLTLTPSFSVTPSITQTSALPPPVLISAPSEGPDAGTVISITGSAFVNGAVVVIGGVPQSATFISSSLLTVTLPASAPGTVTLFVQNPDSQSTSSVNFEFKAPTPTPGAQAGGDPQVKELVPVPQPQQGPIFSFAVKIEGGTADSLELKLYSRSFACIGTFKATGSFGPGWNHPVKFGMPGLSSGLYFIRVQPGVGGKMGKGSKPGKLLVLN